MLILACDTSTDYATFVVGDERGVVGCDISFKHQRDLSQRLYEAIEEVLVGAGHEFSEIGALAVGIGPGSFTGVRIAVTTMKTLAQATGKKLIALGTLDIYSQDASYAGFNNVIAILPSRKGEVYFQIFRKSKPTNSPAVCTYAQLHQLISDRNPELVLCGQTDVLPADFSIYQQYRQFSPSAAAMIELATVKLKAGQIADPLTLSPVYAAPPSISLHKTK